MAIEKLGVVGCGTMGSGIAALAASHGLDVVALKLTGGAPTVVLDRVQRALDRDLATGALAPEAYDAVLARIQPTLDLADLDGCPLVIEACVEDLAIKRALLADIETHVRPGTILATNTSSLPLDELAAPLLRPCRFLGLRFFHAPLTSRLVEVAATARTAHSVVDDVVAFVRSLGKAPMHVGDQPGYIVHRLVYGAGDDRPSIV
jgi:3-hydroxybutyryl-CoA dehydrogenase